MDRGRLVLNMDRGYLVLFKRLCFLFYCWGMLVGSTLIV